MLKKRDGNVTERGFSLIELVVVLAVAAIALFQAVPSFAKWQESLQRASTRELIERDISRAKSEAVASGARTIFSLNKKGSGYTVGRDRAPVADPPTIEEVIFTRTLPNNVSFEVSDAQAIMFDSRGLLVDEFGEPTTVAAALLQKSETFSTMTIYPVGRVCYGANCATL